MEQIKIVEIKDLGEAGFMTDCKCEKCGYIIGGLWRPNSKTLKKGDLINVECEKCLYEKLKIPK